MINALATLANRVSPPAAVPTKPKDELGKEDFMRLLIAQLQKQDPLNPQDPTEFTAQLATFSSLEQLTNINKSLGGLDALGDLGAQSAALGAIGRKATVSGDSIVVNQGTASPVHYDLSRASQATTMKVYNAAGTEVAALDLGGVPAGPNQAVWNGLDAQGRAVASGNYTFKIEAADITGAAIEPETRFSGIVSAVRFDRGEPELEINGAYYSLSQVSSIGAA